MHEGRGFSCRLAMAVCPLHPWDTIPVMCVKHVFVTPPACLFWLFLVVLG